MADEDEQQSVRIDKPLAELAVEQAVRQGITTEDLVAEALRMHLQVSSAQAVSDHPADYPDPEVSPYFAFISYSHADRKIAADLHKRLERFRVPRNLAGRTAESRGLPRRIRPIFRDQEEFPASSDLGRSIRAALRAAHTLVVVCSPRSAASAWVGEEIRYFKQLGRAARILCFIIDGSPSAVDREDEARAALHNALLECYDEKVISFQLAGLNPLQSISGRQGLTRQS